jgi:hypothetical protein
MPLFTNSSTFTSFPTRPLAVVEISEVISDLLNSLRQAIQNHLDVTGAAISPMFRNHHEGDFLACSIPLV